MSAGNRRFPRVALLLLLCVIAATTIMAAAAESTDSETIKILDGEDRTYDFRELESGENPIAITLWNRGNSSASIKVDIVTNLSDTNGTPLHFTTLDYESLSQEVKIPPREVRFLAFRLNRTDLDVDKLHGLYRGYIVLTNQTNTTIAFTLAVPSLPLSGPASFDIKIPDPGTPLKVDYEPLMKNGRIAVGIENTGKQQLYLKGDIILGNLVDTKGSPVPLNFLSENESRVETPVSIMPGQVDFLYLNLTGQPAAGGTLRTGNYSGYIVVTAEEEGLSKRAPLKLFVPSEAEASQTTPGLYAKERMQAALKQISGNYLNHELVLSDDALVAAAVILLAVGIWGIRRLYIRKNRSDPGTVTINSITNASGDSKVNTDGLNALMRDELENVGILPPATKPYESLETAMESIAAVVPGAPSTIGKAISGLLSLIFPKTGHQVTCTLLKKEDTKEFSLICEIIGKKTIEKIDIAEGSSADEAVKKGAVLIYQYIVNEHPDVMQKVPPWSLFSSSDSLELFREGIKLETENARERKNTPAEKVWIDKEDNQKSSEALKKYQRAAERDPVNIRIRLAIIKYLEGKQYLDTVVEYLKLVTLWPVLWEPRYRLAGNLTFVDKLIKECKNPVMGSQRGDLATLLKKCINDEKDYAFGRLIDKEKRKEMLATLEHLEHAGGVFSHQEELQLKDCFLVLARCQYHYLEEQSGWWRCLGKRVYLIHTVPCERTYNPCWKYPDLKKFSKVVRLAHCCARIRYEFIRGTADEKTLESLRSEVEKIVVPSGAEPWEVHYNAACFYALALNVLTNHPQGAEQRTERANDYAKTAIHHLEQVIRDRNYTTSPWLFDEENGDPDLSTLRKCQEFKLFALIVNPNPIEGKKEDRTQEVLNEYHDVEAHWNFTE